MQHEIRPGVFVNEDGTPGDKFQSPLGAGLQNFGAAAEEAMGLTPQLPGPLPGVGPDGVPDMLRRPAMAPQQPAAPQQPMMPVAMNQPPGPAPRAHGGGGGGGGQLGREPGVLAEQRKLEKDSIGLQREQTAIDKDKAQLGADAAGEMAKHQAKYATSIDQIQQQKNADIERRQNRVSDLEDKYQKTNFRDFWADKSQANHVLANIGMAIGAFASSVGGGPNTAMQVVDHAIERDYQMQRDNIMKMKDTIAMARAGVQDAREAKADLLVDAQTKKVATIDAATAEATRLLKLKGVPEAEIAGNAAIVDLQKKSMMERQQLTKGIADIAHVRAETNLANASAQHQRAQAAAAGGTQGKATAEQQKLAILAGQMQGEMATIAANPHAMSPAFLSKLQSTQTFADATDKTAHDGMLGAATAGIARFFGAPKSKYDGLTADEQSVANAWDNLTEKYARVLTGAGMPAEEAHRMALQDQPHAGDSAQVIQQKFQRMASASNQFMAVAGSAAAQVRSVGAAPATGSGSHGGDPGRRGSVAGKPAMIYSDGTYEPI